MSAISQFMHAAREILDEQDRRANPNQPPFFVRTTWLFVELEELALPGEAATFEAIKVARLSGDIAQCSRLVDQVHAASEDRAGANQRHQRQQICGWIKEQIKRETK
jgi:hypothetical protein